LQVLERDGRRGVRLLAAGLFLTVDHVAKLATRPQSGGRSERISARRLSNPLCDCAIPIMGRARIARLYSIDEAFGEAAEHGCQQLAPGSCCAVDAKPRHARVHQRPACSGIAAIEKRRRRPTVIVS